VIDLDGADKPIPTSRELSSEAWRFAARRSWNGFIRHRGIDGAAALSFFSALAIFPGSLTFVSVFAFLDTKHRAVEDILAVVASVATNDTVDTVREPLTQLLSIPNPGIALTLGLLLTLWTSSGYVTAFGRAVNTAYEVQEGRRIWKFRGHMLGVAAVLMVAFSLIAAILLATPTVSEVIAKEIGAPPVALFAWNIGKWAILLGLAVLSVALLYYFTPNVKHLRIRWVSWGAIFAIAVWGLATTGFAFYVLNLSHYNQVYGWLGGAVVLLLWLYLSNLVLVFGAEVDAEIVRVRQLEAGIVAEDVIQLPMRDTKRNLTLAKRRADDLRRGRELREAADRRRNQSGDDSTSDNHNT
jgi:membrane protein